MIDEFLSHLMFCLSYYRLEIRKRLCEYFCV